MNVQYFPSAKYMRADIIIYMYLHFNHLFPLFELLWRSRSSLHVLVQLTAMMSAQVDQGR